MDVVLDEPAAGAAVNSGRFRLRGWAWFGSAHAAIDAVEAWCGTTLLGRSTVFHPRPDVAVAVGIGGEHRTGFDFYGRFPTDTGEAAQEVELRFVTATGSRMGPYCARRVEVRRALQTGAEGAQIQIALDRPAANQAIARDGFTAAGWVWHPERHADISAVELWAGGIRIGETGRLHLRPDVANALAFEGDVATGFEFRADLSALGEVRELDLHVRVRLNDGVVHGPFCSTSVRVHEHAGDAVIASELQAAHQTVATLQKRVRQLEVELAARREPVPPDRLQVRQTGCVSGPLFFETGRTLARQVVKGFAVVGRPLTEARSILDFGCGCGRVLAGLASLGVRGTVWGTDIDSEAIAWNQEHLGRHGQFLVNAAMPPLVFPDGFFDAIYSVSVFTHLPEAMQFAWLAELRRVLAPGGVAVLSVHGAHYWKSVHPDVAAKVAVNGFDYRSAAPTEGLPDFYMVAFHSAGYIRERWSEYFEVLAIEEKLIGSAHDAVVVRRR